MHYKRFWRHGENKVLQVSNQFSAEDRLKRAGWVVVESGCWEFQGRIGTGGYGHLDFGGKTVTASRLAYEVWRGEIPQGLLVCHTCDNRKCINPEHLWLGTSQDNARDRDAKGRAADVRGENSPTAVLTVEQVREAKVAMETESVANVAREMGINYNTLYSIKTGRNWGWL